MKRFLLAASCAIVPVLAQAQTQIGPYVSIGAGINVQPDETINSDPQIADFAHRSVTFNPGFAGEASFGYGFANGLRLDVEADYNSAKVKGISGDDASILRAGGLEERSGGMFNVLYDFNVGLPFIPYVGVGLGAQGLDHSHWERGVIGYKFPTAAGEQTVSDFAYQGILGVAVPLTFFNGLSFTAEYRFLGLLDATPAFAESAYALDGSVTPTSRKFGNTYSHTIMLGFRYAFFQGFPLLGQPSPPPPPMPTPMATPVPEPSRTYLVFFDWDRSDLTVRARAIVREAAQASTHVQTTRLEVNGYTDLSGTAAYNQKLSVRRAQSVATELVRDGVPQAEIEIKGFGESHPLVPTAPGVREPQNRRVEIILH
jgi:outer membrane protein OmpA-like peptidoglycan-associated protein